MVNNIVDLFCGGGRFVLVNCDLIADNPLPEFIGGILTIDQVFWVVQIFFFLVIIVLEPVIITVAGVSSLRLLLKAFISAF